MNLSIFNFNKSIRILVIFIVFFILYNLFIIIYKPNITMLQNQLQQNYSYAQDFIYEKKTPNIIVGSSMAARMKNEFLADNYYNLSFGGGSVLTGLEIIKRSGFVPKNIYIENNVIFRNQDKRMLENLFYPILSDVKKYVPALKEKYQPLNVLSSMIKGSYGRSHDEQMNKKRDEDIFDSNLKRHLNNYNKSLDNYDIELDKLKNLISYFETKNTAVIFFEMPMHSNLTFSIKAKEQRKILKENFVNKWMTLPNNSKYKTTDGIHLMYESAYRFSKKFEKEIIKL